MISFLWITNWKEKQRTVVLSLHVINGIYHILLNFFLISEMDENWTSLEKWWEQSLEQDFIGTMTIT